MSTVASPAPRAVACTTCGSARCGNHAACARRAVAAERRQLWEDRWVWLSASLYVEMHVRAGELPSDEVLRVEFDRIHKETPGVFGVLVAFETGGLFR